MINHTMGVCAICAHHYQYYAILHIVSYRSVCDILNFAIPLYTIRCNGYDSISFIAVLFYLCHCTTLERIEAMSLLHEKARTFFLDLLLEATNYSNTHSIVVMSDQFDAGDYYYECITTCYVQSIDLDYAIKLILAALSLIEIDPHVSYISSETAIIVITLPVDTMKELIIRGNNV